VLLHLQTPSSRMSSNRAARAPRLLCGSFICRWYSSKRKACWDVREWLPIDG
jgi:hypothetical protein